MAELARAEYIAHVEAVGASLDDVTASCFALLPKLGEVESMVRISLGFSWDVRVPAWTAWTPPALRCCPN